MNLKGHTEISSLGPEASADHRVRVLRQRGRARRGSLHQIRRA